MRVLWLIGAVVVTAALVCASLFVGVYDVTGAADGWQMFAITRIPRTMLETAHGPLAAYF